MGAAAWAGSFSAWLPFPPPAWLLPVPSSNAVQCQPHPSCPEPSVTSLIESSCLEGPLDPLAHFHTLIQAVVLITVTDSPDLYGLYELLPLSLKPAIPVCMCGTCLASLLYLVYAPPSF